MSPKPKPRGPASAHLLVRIPTDPSCPAPCHATAYAAHIRGCVCPEAVRAYRLRQKRTRLRRDREGSLLVDKTGAVRRIQALRRLGHPLSVIAAEMGYKSTSGSLKFLFDGQTRRIHRDTVARVVEVYDRLSMTPGGDVRTARHAERQGWPPPLAWDDDEIDDPKARPRRDPRAENFRLVDEVAVAEAMAGRKVRLTKRERWAAASRLAELGLSHRLIADRLGCEVRTVQRLLARHRGEVAA